MKHKKEKMSDEFTKHLLWFNGLKEPFHAVVHHFTAPDKGDPHDHPFRFTTHILKGGYTERQFRIVKEGDRKKWQYRDTFRAPGTSHVVEAETIHTLIDLPNGECWTVMIPEEKTREPRFWQFDEAGARSKAWNEENWTNV